MKEAGRVKESCSELNRFQVTYFPPLSDLLGVSREDANLPSGARLVHLISYLGKSHGDIFLRLFFDDGRWKPQIGIFIAGRPSQNPEMELPPSAEIILLPFLAGG